MKKRIFGFALMVLLSNVQIWTMEGDNASTNNPASENKPIQWWQKDKLWLVEGLVCGFHCLQVLDKIEPGNAEWADLIRLMGTAWGLYKCYCSYLQHRNNNSRIRIFPHMGVYNNLNAVIDVIGGPSLVATSIGLTGTCVKMLTVGQGSYFTGLGLTVGLTEFGLGLYGTRQALCSGAKAIMNIE